MNHVSFSDIAIVSCGTLSLELIYLKQEGFLDTKHLFFIAPGLQEERLFLIASAILITSRLKIRKNF